MGLPTYSCPDDVESKIPRLFEGKRIQLTEVPSNGGRLGYTFRSDWGTVELIWIDQLFDGQAVFFLVCESNPLFWIWDLRLHRRVDEILVRAGARLISM